MFSRISYILSALIMLYASFIFQPKYEHRAGEAVIGWDVAGYYWYLPSIFIYGDLKQQAFADSIFAKYQPAPNFDQSFEHESGNRVMVYSSGMALMYLPAFSIAHLLAAPLGYAPDGFSMPYQLALQIWGVLFALTGLWFFRKLLRCYYSDVIAGIMLLLLVIGSNYLNYAAIDSSLTHNYLFTLYVFLMLLTRAFYKSPGAGYAAGIGLVYGLMVLIRPSEAIALIIPLLWGMESVSISALKERLQFLLRHSKHLLLASVITLAIGSIQLVYWFYVTGDPLIYSYKDKGFSWFSPHFFNYMLSYKSGWLVYTPLLILSFVGIIPFLYRGKNKVAVLSFFVINLYIVAAWDVWWYGGTGGRAMIQSYPIILLPMASLLEAVLTRRSMLKWVLVPILLVFCHVNIWFTYNAHAGQSLYDPDLMSEAYFWNVVGRFRVSDDVLKLKETDEIFRGVPSHKKPLYRNHFETDSLPPDVQPTNGSGSLYVKPHWDSPSYTIPYAGGNGNTWIRVQASFRWGQKEWTCWKMMLMVVRFKRGERIVKERILRPGRYIGDGQTATQYLDVSIPNDKFDHISIIFINSGGDLPMFVDDLSVYSFR